MAKQKEAQLAKEIKNLRSKRINPKLVSILMGDNKSSVIYLKMKKAAAKRVGIDLEVRSIKYEAGIEDVIDLIQKLNKNKNVHGVMVQLPLPKSFSSRARKKIINVILPQKDVDGMRPARAGGGDSPFIAPTVQAVLGAFDQALKVVLRKSSTSVSLKVLVVGAKGFEGRRILEALREKGFRAKGIDLETKDLKGETRNADIIISVTGTPGIIKKDMVKNKVALIDVGSPKGDIEKAAYKKASFVSGVPGGIGPLTISFLLKNLVESAGAL